MMTPLQAFVTDRLAALKRNPFAAAKLAGLERSFLNDILIGRKQSIRGNKIGQMSVALEIAPVELMSALQGSIKDLGGVEIGGDSSSMANDKSRDEIVLMDASVVRLALVTALLGQGSSPEAAETSARLWIEDAKRRAANQNRRPNDSDPKSDDR